MAAVRHEDFIEVQEVSVETVQVNWLVRFWRSLSRRVRRFITRTKARFWRFIDRLPPKLRDALAFAAVFVGTFVVWMLFYLSLIIAAAYGIVTFMGVLCIWAVAIGYLLAQLDPRYGLS